MKVTRTVVLYGDSIVLASMAAVLVQQQDVLVQHIGADPDWTGQVEKLNPDIILFDLAANTPDELLSQLLGKSAPRLIGIDVARRRLLLLNGQQVEGIEISDLLQAIR
jgi:hypothetical protein